jgi:hypothetical protein
MRLVARLGHLHSHRKPGFAVCECMPEKPGPNFPMGAALARHCKREDRDV